MSRDDVGEMTLTIIPDAEAFGRAMRSISRDMTAFADRAGAIMAEFARTVQRVGEQMSRLLMPLRRLAEIADREQHIARFGPRNVDADGEWQSDLCAAWVHDACPSRFCSCGCHR